MGQNFPVVKDTFLVKDFKLINSFEWEIKRKESFDSQSYGNFNRMILDKILLS